MSNVIQFLESMGANASMARMTISDYEAAISTLDADSASREALYSRDHSKLNGLLNGRSIMMCVVAAPEEKQPEQDESPSEGEGDDEKKQID